MMVRGHVALGVQPVHASSRAGPVVTRPDHTPGAKPQVSATITPPVCSSSAEVRPERRRPVRGRPRARPGPRPVPTPVPTQRAGAKDSDPGPDPGAHPPPARRRPSVPSLGRRRPEPRGAGMTTTTTCDGGRLTRPPAGGQIRGQMFIRRITDTSPSDLDIGRYHPIHCSRKAVETHSWRGFCNAGDVRRTFGTNNCAAFGAVVSAGPYHCFRGFRYWLLSE